ncbi:TPA: ECs_2282 family putative zinc-binding protein [Serratia fonticola]
MDIKITCPDCGSEHIKTPTKVNSLDDLTDASCIDCGRAFGKDDVIAKAREVALDAIRNSLGKSGL